MAKEYFMKIKGWAKIDPSTIMAQDYVDDIPKIITLVEWSELPEEIQDAYFPQDYEAALRNAIYMNVKLSSKMIKSI